MDLILTKQVQAILGPRTWEETSLVAEVSSQNHIPVISLADTTPTWAAQRWPFLVQASPNQFMTMKAVAAIILSLEWQQVTIIYEDRDSSTKAVLHHLSNAMREVGAEISQLLARPPFASSSLSLELQRLKEGQCRVFVVHLSLSLAERLFEMAKRMKMMEKDYVWITFDGKVCVWLQLKKPAYFTIQLIFAIIYGSLFQLTFTFIYSTFNKKFSVLAK